VTNGTVTELQQLVTNGKLKQLAIHQLKWIMHRLGLHKVLRDATSAPDAAFTKAEYIHAVTFGLNNNPQLMGVMTSYFPRPLAGNASSHETKSYIARAFFTILSTTVFA